MLGGLQNLITQRLILFYFCVCVSISEIFQRRYILNIPYLNWALGFAELGSNYKHVFLITLEINAILDKNLNQKPDRARGN